jgi:hypothetical protein
MDSLVALDRVSLVGHLPLLDAVTLQVEEGERVWLPGAERGGSPRCCAW